MMNLLLIIAVAAFMTALCVAIELKAHADRETEVARCKLHSDHTS
jgi:hypothetical protein